MKRGILMAINLSDLLSQRQQANSVSSEPTRRPFPRPTAPVTEEGDNGTLTSDGVQSVIEIQNARDRLQEFRSDLQEMSQVSGYEERKEWLQRVGTSINFYEVKEYTDEVVDEFIRVQDEHPKEFEDKHAPRNIQLMLKAKHRRKDLGIKGLIGQIGGVRLAEDEVNRLLGDTSIELGKDEGTIDLLFTQKTE